ncbi:MAG: tetratricopeptide repeat protein [Terriglobia bacterium]|jgi:tetratricopeptide (TPR) repeat protein
MHARDAQPAWQRYLAGDSRGARALAPAAILAATFLAYAGALGFGFVFDDTAGIVRNDSLRAWHYLPSYFTSHVWSFLYPHLLSNYYRPLFLLWLRLNDALFGLHPWGWHLTSVAAHMVVTYLVYCLGFRLTRDAWIAGFAGLIFGLDPVHVEAVAYVSAVPELLSALFLLAAMLAWLRTREGGSNWTWLAALILYSAALLSKESGMMLPIFIAVYAWIYAAEAGEEVGLGKRLGAALGAAAPFLVVTLFYVPLRIWALKGFAHTVTPVDFRMEILTIPSVMIFYLRLLLWPAGLSCYYDTPYISAATFRGFFLPLAGVLVALAVLAGWYYWTRRARPAEARTLAFAAIWTACAILPVLNFRLLPEGEIAHDRYLYLPTVGFSILVALALGQARRAGGFRSRPARVAAGAVVACLLMGIATVRQSLFWSDDLTLNYRAHEVAPQNVYAMTSLAAAVAARGMDGPAMVLYQQALAMQPQFWRANVNVGYLYYAHGNYPEAARFFGRACAADPTDGDQFLYLGMALMRMGQLTDAEKAARTALLVRPKGKNYHLGLGMVLRGEGKLSEARTEVAAELAEDPQNAQAKTLLNEITGQVEGPAGKPAGEQPSKGQSTVIK